MTLQHSGMPGYSPSLGAQTTSAGVGGPSLGPRHKLSPAELLRGAFLEEATARGCPASIPPARFGRVPWGGFSNAPFSVRCDGDSSRRGLRSLTDGWTAGH